MFECRSCLLRCMRAIAADAAPSQRPLRNSLLLTPHLAHRPSRRAASTASVQESRPRDVFDDAEDAANTPPPLPAAGPKDWAKQEKGGAIVIQNQKALEMELRYLKDPLKLVDHVRYTLRDEKPEKALDLCRLASRSMSCVVSWNAVVDWYLRKLKVNKAVEVYNEMKKRAQFPDSYTYMLLLRGLGLRTHVQQPVRQENVTKAVSIYNSMSAPTSRVKPSIMHTNAALNVCSQALDNDALWAIAEKIPERGPGAADHMTYTIILNAVRYNVYGNNPTDVSLDQIAARRQQAVNEGRRVWLDVIRKWRSGSLQIDEDLVGAMGRVLLTSKSIQDHDNVLDLVQQTMKIQRLVPPINDPNRKTEHVPKEPMNEGETPAEDEVDEGFTDSPAAAAFKVVTPLLPEDRKPRTKEPPSLAWVQPGHQTLSLLIDACQTMRTPKTATAYWDLLTSPPYNLKPDLRNFDAQLRLLALNRASAKAAKLLSEDLPAAGIEPKNSTFRIAMHACQRDMKNSRVLEHATTVIDVMEQTAENPDAQTLSEYLSLALTTNDGGKIIKVIDRLDPIVHNLRSLLDYGDPVTGHRDRKNGLDFLSSLVGAIDTLFDRGLIPDQDRSFWLSRRGDLSGFVNRKRALGREYQEHRRREQEEEGDRNFGARSGPRPPGPRLSMGPRAWEERKGRGRDGESKVRREGARERRMNPPRGGWGMHG